MKVFVVVTERDGEITKVPGTTTTEIIRTDHRFAAETFEEVYEYVKRNQDPEETLRVIAEEHASVYVLTPTRREE